MLGFSDQRLGLGFEVLGSRLKYLIGILMAWALSRYLSPSHTLYLSLPHRHTLPRSLSLSHANTHTLKLFLFHTHTHSLFLFALHTHTHTLFVSPSHTHIHTKPYCVVVFCAFFAGLQTSRAIMLPGSYKYASQMSHANKVYKWHCICIALY